MARLSFHRTAPALAPLLLAAATAGAPGSGRVDFRREILPILADRCFACHGPDEKTRTANLRLDLAPGEPGATSGRVLVPGRPAESRLIRRIGEKEPARRMPPPSAGPPLSTQQQELLRRWVSQGARYERHWSLVPLPARVPIPEVKDEKWPRGEIDRFVLARLEREGLQPSPPADRALWLRRVTFDLTGLPPTLAEIEAFLADRRPGAEDRVVDRLLASPRFGEHAAVSWLDLARYADSYGYQSDQLSPFWPYRDWVVRALNANLPYDRLIEQQLAGDLVSPQPTREERLATAFNRLHRMTNEGGSVPEEWRLEGVADRVNTFGTAFLGLTLECARCHDHKYDPISQRDYYALSAFFNSIDEHGLYDRADIVPSPTLLLPTADQERELAAAREAAAAAESEATRVRLARESAFRAWLRGPLRVPDADLLGQFSFEEFRGTVLPNRAPGATQHGARLDEVALVEGRQGKAVELDGENNVHFPELGKFGRHSPFTISFWLWDSRRPAEPAVVFQACSGTDTGPRGYDLLIEQGRLTARLFRHWPGNGIGVATRATVPVRIWTHVAVSYDGSSRASGLRIYLNGRLAPTDLVRDRMTRSIGLHPLVFGQRFRDRGLTGGRIDELHIHSRVLAPLEILRMADPSAWDAAAAAKETREAEWREVYFSALDGPYRQSLDALAAARKRVVDAEDAQMEVAVMEEMPSPRPTHVLARGRYDAPRSKDTLVARGVPASIARFPSGAPRDRLGLARWLTQPDHPLTARVAVNRIWSNFFGRGLVETCENFGLQGRPPTHPELLDWLAREFVRSGWDVKALYRRIALSAAYRQSSAHNPRAVRRDPENLLLWRGPSRRLSAEAIRDLALAASGLLDDRMGGPPVSPYQPGDLWRESNVMSPAYRQSVGRDLYRRSLYTVWKRTAPMPNMIAFDAAGREVCVARRQRTSTPLQALVLLNDPQFVEAQRVLGLRALLEGGHSPHSRVRFLFRTATGREPRPEEAELLERFYRNQLEHYASRPADAAGLLKVGQSPVPEKCDPAEVAALTLLAQAVMNLDAAVWLR